MKTQNLNFGGKSKGQTLIEILVAVSLFGMIGLMIVTVFFNIIRIQGRLALESAIYEDARFMMERIARAVRNNAIDYEEYFNKAKGSSFQYGDLYGCYSAQFYHPGKKIDGTAGTLGALCNDGSNYEGQDCVVYKPSVDINTGQYPYKGQPGLPASSNAICPISAFGGLTCTDQSSYIKDELYLIDKDGRTKTYFAKKKVNSSPVENALGYLKKLGKDTNNDGIYETWRTKSGMTNDYQCDADFDCPSTLASLESTLDGTATGTYQGFIPISPLRTNIKRLQFEISPSEDPRKAFAENNLSQPKVRITLEVEPTAAQMAQYNYPAGSTVPTVVLQTTISSRVQSEVKSYMGYDSQNIGASLYGSAQCPLF